MAAIDPTARVAAGATIGRDVSIGPYCVIGPDVAVGAGCRLIAHVHLTGHTSIGPRTAIHPFASLGSPPQSVKYRGGPTRLVVGADCDVTAQMLAQATLRESEERFRLIANSAPVPMWVTKLDRTRLFANQAYLDFLGQPFEQAIVFDWRTRGRPHPVYVYGGIALVAVKLLNWPISVTPLWHSFAGGILALSQ